ncbi:ORF6N domain-containing protein [Fibrobacter succinogenes]|uniref:ORF6N domain-containing protein n=1 Tax=Fibrobacter succinogenes TaxID=833 RepID=UPI00350E385E
MLKSRIYTIRGLKVMLDADLAEIYGYSTKAFNRQVKNNIEKFDEDFRFQLSNSEIEELSRSKNLILEPQNSLKLANFEPKDNLRSKKLTSSDGSKFELQDILRCKNCTSSWGGVRYAPYAFTEQGIYMLMTVLKGERATAQSKALIRLFKQMKDYIVAENQSLLGSDGIAQIASHTVQNAKDIAEIRDGLAETREDVSVMKSDLQKVMENFIDPSTFKHFLILNGRKLEADVAYMQIYGLAKKSITIVDDYIGVKTLDLLREIAKGVAVTIYSDECGFETLTDRMQKDFLKVRPDISLNVYETNGKFHDRYIFLDYGLKSEKLFHCGASSKDAGNKITTIMQIEYTEAYHNIIAMLKETAKNTKTSSLDKRTLIGENANFNASTQKSSQKST